ncbi:hypothetical protein V8F20_000603 [Naviculisporaceae sp. PSN 640]
MAYDTEAPSTLNILFLTVLALFLGRQLGGHGSNCSGPTGGLSADRRRLVGSQGQALMTTNFHDWILRLAVNEPSTGTWSAEPASTSCQLCRPPSNHRD